MALAHDPVIRDIEVSVTEAMLARPKEAAD
jgi:hypothetical protein